MFCLENHPHLCLFCAKLALITAVWIKSDFFSSKWSLVTFTYSSTEITVKAVDCTPFGKPFILGNEATECPGSDFFLVYFGNSSVLVHRVESSPTCIKILSQLGNPCWVRPWMIIENGICLVFDIPVLSQESVLRWQGLISAVEFSRDRTILRATKVLFSMKMSWVEFILYAELFQNTWIVSKLFRKHPWTLLWRTLLSIYRSGIFSLPSTVSTLNILLLYSCPLCYILVDSP